MRGAEPLRARNIHFGIWGDDGLFTSPNLIINFSREEYKKSKNLEEKTRKKIKLILLFFNLYAKYNSSQIP